MDMLSLSAMKDETTLLLGKINEEITDLFFPDRQGFVYYNNAFEDFPIVFYTGAMISLTRD